MLSDGEEKASAILSEVRASGHKCVIETGTSNGETISHVAAGAPELEIITIENAYDKYMNAFETLHKIPNVQVVYADSGDYLGRLMDYLKKPTVFFLDAHDIDVTAPTPIYSELGAIFYRSDQVEPEARHNIIIDDARLFGTGIWPDVNWLEQQADTHKYTMSVENDFIYLNPQL